ncbi:purine nucleoside transporter PunC [Shewanella sp. 38A_GOM-205m]|uniref:purine nucleoside transporter PunC n=1 Tax=Shewanella sp. 38A_GOM-205m TaxID=1380363 RepID=UPI00048BA9EB|nr:purine nucleoside transporter PunC [Shewanella sp. 38A_GOM-205m]
MTLKYFMFLCYLALLSMLAFIATDMYLPAFKAIESSLGASSSQVAMSLTSFLAGLALGQLLYGPLVQRFGKRNSLLGGLALFALATVSIGFSDNIIMLNCARFFQAIGVCSAAVIWQALVVEQYDAKDSQRIFSNIMPLVALSPALAPILGAKVLGHLGWEAIFFILAATATALMALTMVLVKPANEGTAKAEEKVAYKTFFNNTGYLGNVFIYGACSGAFFAYLTLWPIVMEQHGYEADAIGLSFIPQTIMFIVGGYASKLLIRRVGSEMTLKLLLALFGLCVLAIALATLVFKAQTIYPLLIAFSVLAAANGAIYPIVVNSALQHFSQCASKAAGLQNFLQITLAFGASSLVAVWATAGETAIAWGILGCSVLVFAGYKLRQFAGWSQVRAGFTKPDPARLALRAEETPKD